MGGALSHMIGEQVEPHVDAELCRVESPAAHVLDGLSRIGRNHKPHIERANFAVLRTSDMPAMLVETAFISNPDEERRLSDPTYQRQLARALRH